MTMPDIRPMGVGEVLDRSFQVLRRHMPTLFLTAILGTAPLLLVYVLVGIPYGAYSAAADPAAAFPVGFFLGMMVVSLIATALVWGALTRDVDQAVTGGAVALGDGLRYGLRSLLRLLGVAVLLYLAFLGVMLPVGLLMAVVAGVGTALLGNGIVSILLTAVATLVPGFIALVVWTALAFLMMPVVICEDVGPIRALRRANELGKGGRLRVFATALVAWLVVVLPTFGIPYLLGMGSALWNPAVAGTMSVTQAFLYQGTMFVVGGLTTPFLTATMVFTYYDRRVRREGYDVELASAALPLGG